MEKPRVITLGCRLNTLESEVMRRHAEAAGLADTIIVNTCTVTAEAVRQARQTVRRARRQNPQARIVVTGCAAQMEPETFAAMPEVDKVLGNWEKLDAASFEADTLDGPDKVAVADIMTVHGPGATPFLGPPLAGFDGRTRAFAQVQRGCDHRCTFCIIPLARGPARCVPPEGIVDQVRRLTANGYREVVLTGVDICSYGNDLPGRPTLGAAVRRLLAAVPELDRLRLSSLDPAAVDDDLIRLLGAEARLMPHLHLSLQAGDDTILKRMKRRHLMADAARLCARARGARPDVVFGADLIAGFPTETDAMFANTLAAIGGLGLTYLHVFPYSPRAGTAAARMPQVAPGVRRERAARLREAGEAALGHYLRNRVGTRAEVLVEDDGAGRSQHYAPVRLSFAAPSGTIVAARVAAVAGGHLIGDRAP